MKNRELVFLAGITILGLTLRIIFLLALRSGWPGWDTPTIDALYHHLWAKQIAAGNIIGGGPYFRAPLYPYFLGLLYSIFGVNFSIVLLIQHLVGVMAVPFVYLLAREYFKPGVAAVAAVLTAINGVLIYFESQLLLDFLTVVFMLAMIYAMTAAQKRDRPWLCFLAGILAGAFAITRPNILAVVPLLWLWIFITGVSIRRKMAGILALTAGMVVLVAPVTLRNTIVGRDVVLIASQGGINFYIGNNPQADGYTALLPGFGYSWQYSDAEYAAAVELGRAPGSLKPSEVSDFYSGKALAFVESSPLDFAKLMVKKLYLFWNYFEISNNNNLYFLIDHIGMSFYPLFLFAIISPLGLVGALLCIFRSKRHSLFALVIFGYMATVIMFFVTSRFRLPLIPLLTITASYTLYELVRQIRSGRMWRTFALTAAIVAAGLLAWTNLYGHHDRSMAMANYSLGNTYLKKGNYDQAERQYQLALSQAACVPTAHLNLGVIAFYRGRTADAEAEFRREIDACGPSAKAFGNLSMLARLAGDYVKSYALADSAISYFPNSKEAYIQRILAASGADDPRLIEIAVRGFSEMFPEDLAARYYLGQYYLGNGNDKMAKESFDQVVRQTSQDLVSEYDLSEIYSAALPHGYDPQKIRGKAFYHLGLLSVRDGDIEKAQRYFAHAVQLTPDDADAHHNLALAYDQLGNFRLAVGEFLRAIDLEGNNPIYYYNYALSLGKAGDYGRAAEMLEKALSLKPDFTQAKTVLEALRRAE